MLVTNATILAVTEPASLDDYDAPPADTPKWLNDGTDENCYLEQKTRRVSNGQGGQNYVREWTLYLDLGMPPVIINIGDLITVSQTQADGTAPSWTLPVMSAETRQQTGMPADVQSRSILLDPTSAGA